MNNIVVLAANRLPRIDGGTLHLCNGRLAIVQVIPLHRRAPTSRKP